MSKLSNGVNVEQAWQKMEEETAVTVSEEQISKDLAATADIDGHALAVRCNDEQAAIAANNSDVEAQTKQAMHRGQKRTGFVPSDSDGQEFDQNIPV